LFHFVVTAHFISILLLWYEKLVFADEKGYIEESITAS